MTADKRWQWTYTHWKALFWHSIFCSSHCKGDLYCDCCTL